MVCLRWKYQLNVDVEETRDALASRGFWVRELEGQSRTYQEPYPLNQIEVKGAVLGSDVKVVVGPNSSQVYFYLKEMPEPAELESLVENLWKIEQVLNEVVIFVPNETIRFSMQTRNPVMSIDMVKIHYALKEKLHQVFEGLNEQVLKEILATQVLLVQGKIGCAIKRLDAFLGELVEFQRSLIQMARDQGIEGAEKWESQLNEMESQLRNFENELTSAKSPTEFRNLFDKYLSSISESGSM